MLSVLVNTIAVLAGSLIGILFRNRLKESLRNSVMKALGLCTILIGVMSAIQTKELLCIILCMVLGTILGELLKIDDGIEHAGDAIKAKLLKGKASNSGLESFTDGFVSACILFCIGSMTIVGSLEAGKVADMVVLSRNPYEIPADEIRSIQVLHTILGGKEYIPQKQSVAGCMLRGMGSRRKA